MAKAQTLEEMKTQRDILSRKINNIEFKAATEANKAKVGKCFVYKNNCFSMPTKKSDYWDVYYRVTKVSGQYLYGNSCSKDAHGKIEFTSGRLMMLNRLIEITPKRYESKRKQLLKMAAKQL